MADVRSSRVWKKINYLVYLNAAGRLGVLVTALLIVHTGVCSVLGPRWDEWMFDGTWMVGPDQPPPVLRQWG